MIRVLLLLSFIDITFSFQCLPSCTCTPLRGLKTQSCDDKNFISFPGNIDNSTQFIRLERNAISELPSNLSKIVPDLVEIDLTENKIKRLHKNSFANIKKLQTIKLVRNDISQVDAYLLSGIESLSMALKLRFNNISQIHKHAFSNFYADTHLDLSHNKLQTLHSDTLTDIKLLTLNLEHNQFRDIPDGLFRKQNKLFLLKLRNNLIERLNNNVFRGLTGLETLDMSENDLYTLPPNIFSHTPSLRRLKLTGNRFNFLPLDIPDNVKVQMHGNPLHCDCALKYTLAEEKIRNIFYDIDNVICINSTKTTKEYLNEIDCRTTTPQPTTTPNITATIPVGPVSGTTPKSVTVPKKGNARGSNKGVIIGIIIGVIIIVFLLILFVYLYRRWITEKVQEGITTISSLRRKRKADKDEKHEFKKSASVIDHDFHYSSQVGFHGSGTAMLNNHEPDEADV